jgi:hypothetical protein
LAKGKQALRHRQQSSSPDEGGRDIRVQINAYCGKQLLTSFGAKLDGFDVNRVKRIHLH